MYLSFLLNNFLDILASVIIDWMIGDPLWFPHPVIYIGRLISILEKVGRKKCKSNLALKLFGGIIVVIVAFCSFIIPFVILKVSMRIPVLYHIINISLMWTTIAAKCLKDEARKVYFALKNGDIDDARKKLSYIVGRDTQNLSYQEVIRADIETVAENTSDGVIAPLLYGILFGTPCAMMYKGINTMDSMLGYMNEKYRYIGFFPAKVDDIANFFPSRITGILICIASIFVRGNPVYSLKIMVRDRRNHKSPNCAYPEAAAAGAMGIQIGGTNIYFGEIVKKPTIGNKVKELNPEHISSCIKLMYLSEVLVIILYTSIFFVLKEW